MSIRGKEFRKNRGGSEAVFLKAQEEYSVAI